MRRRRQHAATSIVRSSLKNPARFAILGDALRRGIGRRAMQEDIVLSMTPDAAHSADPAATTATAAMAHPKGASSEQQLARILTSLDDDKAEEIVQIDLRGKSTIGDHMVICSGRSTRQVTAIAEKLADRLKQELNVASRMEGKQTGDWVLIDTGDIIVHVFRPEVRDFYQLEKMWLPADGLTASQQNVQPDHQPHS